MTVFVCVGRQLQCLSTGAWQSSKKYWLLHHLYCTLMLAILQCGP